MQIQWLHIRVYLNHRKVIYG